MNYTFTDGDMRQLLREAPKAPQLRRALPFVSTIGLTILALVVAISFVAPRQTGALTNPLIAPSTATLPQADAAAQVQPTAAPVAVATPLPVTLPNETLSISALGISAPVSWNVAFTDKAMNSALQKGLIHLTGTPVPGQQGMAAIAGHSSNVPWAKGDYNHIFAPLTKVEVGHIIELNANGTMYRYQVTKLSEVMPTDVAILSDHSKTGIRLITCTPVGTSLRRLIVEAEQLFPDPSTAAPFNGSTLTGALPGDA